MYEGLKNRQIICIDIRSFFASCAAADAGLDVTNTPIAVIGNLQQKGSIVLAASPPMKKQFGVKTGTRLFEIPDHPSIHLIEPKMEFFVRVSMEITRYLHQFVPHESIHVYSVDECFVDLGGTEKLWGPVENTIKRIQDELYAQFQLPCAVGMGPNMLMAKLALDLEAKKTGFAKWTYDDVQEKLWPVTPLSEMWGIGSRLQKTLNNMGIFKVGQLANTPLSLLEEKFGVMGNQLYFHAWGVDISELGAPLAEGQISYGKGQILFRDYRSKKEVMAVVLEMCEDVARRAREAEMVGRTIHLSVGYSQDEFGGGFNRSRSIDEPTNATLTIYKVCEQIFDEFYDRRPVRKLSISITNLEPEYSMQLSLFEENKWKERKLGKTMDALRSKYGSTAILRAVSYTEAGTARTRAGLLGGHKK
ncbi:MULTISPECIES: DNA polymerase thumb domain-containing protein [Psychrobacillus]|uniref:UV damage repair protein UvrX n=1 Tax=Psychrobacillus psychrodurans TaxID=126157 RepID=A0A9X3LCN3_9BACI|nr:UV damage repair protein UvrX [Psychrobacillus psychrodurans]MCZ8535513.1 UV damage repair protein UvrX [Psychrobacillus psychrodurans]MCZ8539761.1 UV damage repair protein UvrX [Psychrobacillus psychrodurans]SFM92985.1 DNA polymerase V [Psychrobacillus psychrodurans]